MLRWSKPFADPALTASTSHSKLGGRITAETATPRAGTGVGRVRKDAAEMALIGKSAPKRDFGQRQRGIDQQLLGLRDALFDQPSMRRLAGRLLERANKMAGGEVHGTRQLRQRYPLLKT